MWWWIRGLLTPSYFATKQILFLVCRGTTAGTCFILQSGVIGSPPICRKLETPFTNWTFKITAQRHLKSHQPHNEEQNIDVVITVVEAGVGARDPYSFLPPPAYRPPPSPLWYAPSTAALGPYLPRAVPREASGEKLRLLRLQMVTSPPPFTTSSSSPTSPSSLDVLFSFEYENSSISAEIRAPETAYINFLMIAEYITKYNSQ